jgi:hypothetical protein
MSTSGLPLPERLGFFLGAKWESASRSPKGGDLPMSEAVHEMVIDHADGLHVRVDNRRPHEGEAAALQILAHGVGWGAASGDLPHGSSAILDRATVNEAPLVCIEAAKLRLHVEKRYGVLDRRFNLRSIAHDSSICQQLADFPLVVAGDFPRVEVVEGAPVRIPLAQNRYPAEPGLGTFKDEKLEEGAIVVYGNAPFFVVVGDVQRVGA